MDKHKLADEYISQVLREHDYLNKPTALALALLRACEEILTLRSPGQTPEDAAGEPQSQGGPIIPGDLLSQQDGTFSQPGFGESHGHVVIREPTDELDGLVMCPSCEQPTELNPSPEYRIYCHNLISPGQFCRYKETI